MKKGGNSAFSSLLWRWPITNWWRGKNLVLMDNLPPTMQSVMKQEIYLKWPHQRSIWFTSTSPFIEELHTEDPALWESLLACWQATCSCAQVQQVLPTTSLTLGFFSLQDWSLGIRSANICTHTSITCPVLCSVHSAHNQEGISSTCQGRYSLILHNPLPIIYTH